MIRGLEYILRNRVRDVQEIKKVKSHSIIM